jgi:hypothetical protein
VIAVLLKISRFGSTHKGRRFFSVSNASFQLNSSRHVRHWP